MAEALIFLVGFNRFFLARSQVEVDLDEQGSVAEGLDLDHKVLLTWAIILQLAGRVDLAKASQAHRLAKPPGATTKVFDC